MGGTRQRQSLGDMAKQARLEHDARKYARCPVCDRLIWLDVYVACEVIRAVCVDCSKPGHPCATCTRCVKGVESVWMCAGCVEGAADD